MHATHSPGLMLTKMVTLAVRPEISGSPIDRTSMLPPSWESVMPTLTAGENAFAMVSLPLSKLATSKITRRMEEDGIKKLFQLNVVGHTNMVILLPPPTADEDGR